MYTKLAQEELTQVTDEFIQQDLEYTKRKKRNKRGGPYSKNEHDARREEVHRLHFDLRYSGRKIAELLNVNRNTINEDIKFLYSEISREISDNNMTSSILRQIHSLELQKNRLRKEIKKTRDPKQKLAIEKLIFQIDSRITQYFIKIRSSREQSLGLPVVEDPDNVPVKVTIPEHEIKEFVLGMIYKNRKLVDNGGIYSSDDIIFELMQKKKCDEQHASDFFHSMKGLGVCVEKYETKQEGLQIRDIPVYNLGKFAHLKRYITSEEFERIRKK